MAQELIELPLCDNRRWSLMAARCIQYEVLEQERNVLFALPQRRQIDDRHVQTIEQVLSELALFHQFDQIRLAGGDNAEIDRYRIVGPQPFNLSLLQDRRSLTCIAGGMLSISSRKRVPPCACCFVPSSTSGSPSTSNTLRMGDIAQAAGDFTPLYRRGSSAWLARAAFHHLVLCFPCSSASDRPISTPLTSVA